ncbi:MAG: DUF4298 domain-containing protein [Oscillospiraceae bacterium]|nr:DUF4298 domain-containing protein [Oscillospiraceae bacterium]
MYRIDRIKAMEAKFNSSLEAISALQSALDRYIAAAEDIKALEDYLSAGEWKDDFAADEAGLLPFDLKRGVLSEDGIYDMLSDNAELIARLKELAQSTGGGENEGER